MFLGAAGVGKTSLLHGLMNQRLPDKIESTMLAKITSVKCSSTDFQWTEVTEDDQITEEVQAVMNSTMMDSLPKPHLKESSLYSEIVQHKKKIVHQGSKQSLSTADQQVFLHIWDCSGHPVSLDVLPVFMTSQTLLLLSFNASERDTAGQQWFPSIFTTLTSHFRVHEWMAMIHARFGGDQQEMLPNCPRVVLVGTHADYIAPDKPHEEQKKLVSEVLDELLASIKTKEYADMVLGGVVVDNTTAGMGPQEDPGFKKLREIVYSFVHDKLTIETPISWIHFRNVLQLCVMKQNVSVMQLGEVYSIAKECHVIVENVPSALQSYHNFRVFLFYPDIEGLKSVLFLKPQWLIDQAGDWIGHAKDNDLWDTVERYGVLVEPLYKSVLSHVREHNLTPSLLIGMLEHFLLATPIANTGLFTRSGKVKEYFIPHMLQVYQIFSTSYKFSFVKKASSIYLIFYSGCVPPGYFVRLVTSLASKQEVMVLFHPIYRDQITMEIGVDRLTITEHTETIELQYSRQAANRDESFRESCRKLLRLLINECFSEVQKWLPGARPWLAFPCLVCARVAQPLIFSQDKFCNFKFSLSSGQHLHCQMGHKFQPTHAQQYWLNYEMNTIECDQAQFEVHHNIFIIKL